MEKTNVKLSERDYFFLLGMNKKYIYIGRDKRGMLWAFERKPSRGKEEWTLYWDYEMIKINSGLFMDITWESGELYMVEELKELGKEEPYHVTNRR